MSNSVTILSTKTLDKELIEKAAQQGINIDCRAFIRITADLSEEVKTQIEDIASRKAFVAITSSNAVGVLSEYLGERTLDWKVFCISGQTCESVKDTLTGVEIVDTAETGEQLAAKIKACNEIKELVFFGSNIRTPALANGLFGGHISLTEIFLYKTEEVPVKVDKDYNGILFFSPSAVRSFFSKNTAPATTTFFTIGTTTAMALSGYHNKVITSEQPSQESVINKLIEFYKRA